MNKTLRPLHYARESMTVYSSVLDRARFCALLIALMTLCMLPARAQTPEFNDFHTWADLATIKDFSERFRYDGDYGVRGLLTDGDWTQVYLRPSVRYRAKSWMTLHGGLGLFYSFFDEEDLPELRPWIGARFAARTSSDWVISNYLRLEYRAFHLKSEDDWDTSLRARWQLQARSPLFKIASARNFYGLVSIEPFFTLYSNDREAFGDRFRFNMGIGRPMTERLRAEINYLFHKVRLPDEGGSLEVDDHVIRLRLFYTIGKRL
jgi:hypothetical protein